MTMTTVVGGRPGAFRRLMNKVAGWSQAMDYSGFDYTFARIAWVERESAALRDRIAIARLLSGRSKFASDVPFWAGG
jgi:hypothetical protein